MRKGKNALFPDLQDILLYNEASDTNSASNYSAKPDYRAVSHQFCL